MSKTCLYYMTADNNVVTFNSIDFTKHVSKKDELSFVNTEDSIPFAANEECYIVSAEWLEKWFAYVSTETASNVARPGLINNETLIDSKTGQIKATMNFKTDFRPVKKSTWEYFFSLYGSRAVIYFKVPEMFEEKAYKKGTWAKNMNFHKLDVTVIYPSHEVPNKYVVSRGQSFDLNVRDFVKPEDMPMREISIKTRTSHEIAIIGHELKSNAPAKGFHIVYIVEIVTPNGADHMMVEAWHVSRRYDDFAALDKYLRRGRSLVIPSMPGKRYFRSSTSQTFLDQRQMRLEAYLKALTLQAIVWENLDFKRFIDVKIIRYVDESHSFYMSNNASANRGNDTRMNEPLLVDQKKSSSVFGCCMKKSASSPTPSPVRVPPPKPVEPSPISRPTPAPAPTIVIPTLPTIEETKEMSIPFAINTSVSDRPSGDDGSFDGNKSFLDNVSDIQSGDSKQSSHSYQPRFKSNRRHSALPTTPEAGTKPSQGFGQGQGNGHGNSFSSNPSTSNESRNAPSNGSTGGRRPAEARRSLY